MRILIDTVPFDEHAGAIKWALERRGHRVELFYLSDFPARQGLSILYDRGTSVRVNGVDGIMDSAIYDRAILRRRRGVNLSLQTQKPDQDFALREATTVGNAIAECFQVSGGWINPPDAAARANSKLLQLKYAQTVGLSIPKTLISNCPLDVSRFCEMVGGIMAVKPLTTATWSARDGVAHHAFTAKVQSGDVARLSDSIKLAPSIYQQYIAKSKELRVVVMGTSVFVAELNTQEDPRTETDWRLHQTIHGPLKIRSGNIPGAVANQCLKLMERFGIIFGSFDFIEREDGELIFLEVNQMGQFLWLDTCRAFPMLSAFCDFVEDGTGAFCWSGAVHEDLRYADYAKTAEHNMFLSKDSLHIEPNVTFSYVE